MDPGVLNQYKRSTYSALQGGKQFKYVYHLEIWNRTKYCTDRRIKWFSVKLDGKILQKIDK